MRFTAPTSLKTLTAVCAILCTAGCTATLQSLAKHTSDTTAESTATPDADRNMEYLAAIDLINVMVQVPRLHPANNTFFQMFKPESGFGKNVYEVMKVAGYSVQLVHSRDTRTPFISYSKNPQSDQTTFQIELNDFKVKRSYQLVAGRVEPTHPVYVYGADPDNINTDNSIFQRFEPSQLTAQ